MGVEGKVVEFDQGRELIRWLAILTMTIDHVGAILLPDLYLLRLIGRLSFPLFSYLLILGLESTRSTKRYFARLLIFAVVSQIPYQLAFKLKIFHELNIFFTLSSGLLFVYLLKKRNFILAILLALDTVLFELDYGLYGILSIGCMQIILSDIGLGVASIFILNLIFLPIWPNQFLSLFALIFILLHRISFPGFPRKTIQRGIYPIWRKYFFYIYYPLHLFVLFYLRNNPVS